MAGRHRSGIVIAVGPGPHPLRVRHGDHRDADCNLRADPDSANLRPPSAAASPTAIDPDDTGCHRRPCNSGFWNGHGRPAGVAHPRAGYDDRRAQ